jgi:hypothetical protein
MRDRSSLAAFISCLLCKFVHKPAVKRFNAFRLIGDLHRSLHLIQSSVELEA